MKQYLDLMKHTFKEGVMITNSRTKSVCLTTLDWTLKYKPNEFPLVTTRKSYWKQAICEMLCYIRAYTELEDFHKLGVHTWDKNAENWLHLANPYGNSVGIIYGVSAEAVGMGYSNIMDMIARNPSDRGIIWSFWNPEYFNKGCLRPCMYSHQFNVLDNTLYLTSIQRSVDIPLGLNFNMVQVWFLGALTAHLSGLSFGGATHHLVNCHIYENQVEGVIEQTQREPYMPPQLVFKKQITLDDVMRNITKDNFDEYFELIGYQHHPAIKYPFTV